MVTTFDVSLRYAPFCRISPSDETDLYNAIINGAHGNYGNLTWLGSPVSHGYV